MFPLSAAHLTRDGGTGRDQTVGFDKHILLLLDNLFETTMKLQGARAPRGLAFVDEIVNVAHVLLLLLLSIFIYSDTFHELTD